MTKKQLNALDPNESLNYSVAAKIFVKQYPCKCYGKTLYFFDEVEKIYKIETEESLMQKIDGFIESMRPKKNSINIRKELYEKILTITYDEKFGGKLSDLQKYEVYLKDCVVNLKTKEHRPYNNNDIVFSKFDCSYDEVLHSEKPTKFMARLDDIFHNYYHKEDVINFFLEMAGYIMYPGIIEPGNVVLYGPPKSGKSTLIEAIYRSIGIEKMVALSVRELEREQQRATIAGKYLVYDDELDEGEDFRGKNFKTISTGKPISGKVIFKIPATIIPFCKIWSSSNHMPDLDMKDGGYRRVFYFYTKRQKKGNNNFLIEEIIEQEGKQILCLLIRSLFSLMDKFVENQTIENICPVELIIEKLSYATCDRNPIYEAIVKDIFDKHIGVEINHISKEKLDDLFKQIPELCGGRLKLNCTTEPFKQLDKLGWVKTSDRKGYERNAQ